MTSLRIERSVDLPHAQIEALAAEARHEGFRFLHRLIADWDAGDNRFGEPGEAFFLAFSGSRLIGCCGLNRDPFLKDPRVGRLRRLYVCRDYRRHGVASRLTVASVAAGRGFFDRIRLRTDEAAASAFYLRRGFSPVRDPEATHERSLC